MAQTVFDVGDLITSRLKLGVTPDITTAATVDVYRPDGTAILGLNTSAWVGDEKTVQFYATDDAEVDGTVAAAAGDWLVIWRVTGTGASVSPKIYPVTPMPGTSTRPAWSPFLSDVADHVPWLTVDMTTPGSQFYLGTFTGWTSPTDEQAQRVTDRAASLTATYVGVVPSGSQALIYGLARTATALRAAAMLARAYARKREEIDVATALAADAAAAIGALEEAAGNVGADPINAQPLWYAPDPVWYGDLDL